MRVLIPGGSGVFGRLLARELLDTTSADLVLASRDRRRAEAACHDLHAPDRVRALALDLTNPDALTTAAAGCFAVACAAGPFQSLPRALPSAALQAGAHWLDIADDPDWVLAALADHGLDRSAMAAGLAVMPGLSTVPALSGVLVRWCRDGLPEGDRARITLFIGNRNAKGAGAIASALDAGFSHPRPVALPFGRRTTFRFASPDAALLREEFNVRAEFRVGFELGAANRLVAVAARLADRLGPDGRVRLGRMLAMLAAPARRFGSSRSCLQVEMWDAHGRRVRAACIGAGQRLAILPCALAVEALIVGELTDRGVARPAGWLAPDVWVTCLRARGIRFVTDAR